MGDMTKITRELCRKTNTIVWNYNSNNISVHLDIFTVSKKGDVNDKKKPIRWELLILRNI